MKMYSEVIKSVFVMSFVFLSQYFNFFGFYEETHSSIIGSLVGFLIGFTIFFILNLKLNIYFGLKKIKIGNDETIVKEQGASHMTKWLNITGKLFLTPSNLIFKSQYKVEKYDISIPIIEIKKVKIYRLFGFITIGLKIITANKTGTFLLSRPKKWVQALGTILP